MIAIHRLLIYLGINNYVQNNTYYTEYTQLTCTTNAKTINTYTHTMYTQPFYGDIEPTT